jgi:hypothetical protein
MRTIAELAKEACEVQDACNLRAVARGLVRATDDLDALGIAGDALREHPVTRAWVDKLASLASVQGSYGEANASYAHRDCEKLAGG